MSLESSWKMQNSIQSRISVQCTVCRVQHVVWGVGWVVWGGWCGVCDVGWVVWSVDVGWMVCVGGDYTCIHVYTWGAMTFLICGMR